LGCHLQNANDAETLKLWKAVEVATNKYLQAESKVTAKEEKKVFVYIPPGKLYLLKCSFAGSFNSLRSCSLLVRQTSSFFCLFKLKEFFLGGQKGLEATIMELDVAIASDSEKLSEHEIHRIESSETKAVSFSQAFHMSLEMKRLLEERIKTERGWTVSDGSFLQRCGSYNEVKFVAFDKRWVVRKFLLICFFLGHPMQNAEVQKLQAKMLEHEYERNIDEGKSEVAKLDKKIKDLRREKDTESADDFLFRSKSDELADKEASLAKMLYFLPVFSFSSPTSWCLCAYFIVFLEPNNNYFVQHRYLMQTIGFWVPV
jgi:hypothetical protein